MLKLSSLPLCVQGRLQELIVALFSVIHTVGRNYHTNDGQTDRRVPLVTRVTNGAPLFDDSPPMGLYDYMIDHWNCRPL
jgi:hypothetical protein